MREKITRTLKIISVTVLVIGLLSLFGFFVQHAASHGQLLGPLTRPLLVFVNLPKTVLDFFEEIRGFPPTYTNKNQQVSQINNMQYDLFGLGSFYNDDDHLWEIRLFNFRTDSIIHTWNLKKEYYFMEGLQFKRSRPKNGILLPGKSIIVYNNESNNLYRLDSLSNVIWHNTERNFHHSINVSHEGNIWVCTSGMRGFVSRRYGGQESYYRDDFITKVHSETGEILFNKSISEILMENGYKSFVYGYQTNWDKYTGYPDPIHLNDIEPVLHDGLYWKKGDLFISIRNKSLVFHYRPETNEIKHLIYGPFCNQHDVDVISNDEISIFNNNSTDLDWKGIENDRRWTNKEIEIDKLIYSEITIYNFKDSTFRRHLSHQFTELRIFSHAEGLHQILSNGDVFVESDDNSMIYIFNEEQILLRKQYPTSDDNLVHIPNWTRIYETLF